MNDFISVLYDYINEHTASLRNDPEYQRSRQTLTALEEKVKEKAGDDLLYQYQCAQADVAHRQDVAFFLQTLRFSHRFLLEMLN